MHIIASDLGAIVKRARLSKDITQEKLAEKAGVGLRHIMAIENEGSYPSYEVLYKLVRELNISTEEIFFPENNIDDPELDYLIRLLKRLRSLGRSADRDIRLMTELAKAMLGDADES